MTSSSSQFVQSTWILNIEKYLYSIYLRDLTHDVVADLLQLSLLAVTLVQVGRVERNELIILRADQHHFLEGRKSLAFR